MEETLRMVYKDTSELNKTNLNEFNCDYLNITLKVINNKSEQCYIIKRAVSTLKLLDSHMLRLLFLIRLNQQQFQQKLLELHMLVQN